MSSKEEEFTFPSTPGITESSNGVSEESNNPRMPTTTSNVALKIQADDLEMTSEKGNIIDSMISSPALSLPAIFSTLEASIGNGDETADQKTPLKTPKQYLEVLENFGMNLETEVSKQQSMDEDLLGSVSIVINVENFNGSGTETNNQNTHLETSRESLKVSEEEITMESDMSISECTKEETLNSSSISANMETSIANEEETINLTTPLKTTKQTLKVCDSVTNSVEMSVLTPKSTTDDVLKCSGTSAKLQTPREIEVEIESQETQLIVSNQTPTVDDIVENSMNRTKTMTDETGFSESLLLPESKATVDDMLISSPSLTEVEAYTGNGEKTSNSQEQLGVTNETQKACESEIGSEDCTLVPELKTKAENTDVSDSVLEIVPKSADEDTLISSSASAVEALTENGEELSNQLAQLETPKKESLTADHMETIADINVPIDNILFSTTCPVTLPGRNTEEIGKSNGETQLETPQQIKEVDQEHKTAEKNTTPDKTTKEENTLLPSPTSYKEDASNDLLKETKSPKTPLITPKRSMRIRKVVKTIEDKDLPLDEVMNQHEPISSPPTKNEEIEEDLIEESSNVIEEEATNSKTPLEIPPVVVRRGRRGKIAAAKTTTAATLRTAYKSQRKTVSARIPKKSFSEEKKDETPVEQVNTEAPVEEVNTETPVEQVKIETPVRRRGRTANVKTPVQTTTTEVKSTEGDEMVNQDQETPITLETQKKIPRGRPTENQMANLSIEKPVTKRAVGRPKRGRKSAFARTPVRSNRKKNVTKEAQTSAEQVEIKTPVKRSVVTRKVRTPSSPNLRSADQKALKTTATQTNSPPPRRRGGGSMKDDSTPVSGKKLTGSSPNLTMSPALRKQTATSISSQSSEKHFSPEPKRVKTGVENSRVTRGRKRKIETSNSITGFGKIKSLQKEEPDKVSGSRRNKRSMENEEDTAPQETKVRKSNTVVDQKDEKGVIDTKERSISVPTPNLKTRGQNKKTVDVEENVVTEITIPKTSARGRKRNVVEVEVSLTRVPTPQATEATKKKKVVEDEMSLSQVPTPQPTRRGRTKKVVETEVSLTRVPTPQSAASGRKKKMVEPDVSLTRVSTPEPVRRGRPKKAVEVEVSVVGVPTLEPVGRRQRKKPIEAEVSLTEVPTPEPVGRGQRKKAIEPEVSLTRVPTPEPAGRGQRKKAIEPEVSLTRAPTPEPVGRRLRKKVVKAEVSLTPVSTTEPTRRGRTKKLVETEVSLTLVSTSDPTRRGRSRNVIEVETEEEKESETSATNKKPNSLGKKKKSEGNEITDTMKTSKHAPARTEKGMRPTSGKGRGREKNVKTETAARKDSKDETVPHVNKKGRTSSPYQSASELKSGAATPNTESDKQNSVTKEERAEKNVNLRRRGSRKRRKI